VISSGITGCVGAVTIGGRACQARLGMADAQMASPGPASTTADVDRIAPPVPVTPATADIAADATLVAESRKGIPGALERLVERYQADVFGTALRLTRERDVALELTNSIFFKVYQNLEAYEPGRPLRPWLLRIATNETLNWLRSRRREREHVLGSEASDVAFEQLQAGDDPEAAALSTEQRETVRDALAGLPEHYRLVLTLRFFNDLSYQEIAEQTGQDANTVGVQLLRGRQLLKRALLAGAAGPGSQDKDTAGQGRRNRETEAPPAAPTTPATPTASAARGSRALGAQPPGPQPPGPKETHR
jgi:RNA polymerase sigma factor (sigma-70 family)